MKQRIEWIDRMRGLAILSVVVQHLTYNFDNVFVYHKIIGIANMAVFFFVSGYIIEKTSSIGNSKEAVRFLWKKTQQLMLPFLIWQFLVWPYFFKTSWELPLPATIIEGFVHPGLWFLLTLYGYMLCFAGYKLLCVNIRGGVIYWIVIMLLLVVLWKFVAILDFHLSVLYLPYFSAGVLVSGCRKEAWLDNRLLAFFSLFIVCLATCFWTSGATSPINVLLKVVVSFAVIQLTWLICVRCHWNKKADTYVQRCGTMSLAIYVVHWTFLTLRPYHLMLPQNELLALLLATVIALLIAEASMMIKRLVAQIPIADYLLFGVNRKKELIHEPQLRGEKVASNTELDKKNVYQ